MPVKQPEFNRLGFEYLVWKGGIVYRTPSRRDAMAFVKVMMGTPQHKPGNYIVYRTSKRTVRAVRVGHPFRYAL